MTPASRRWLLAGLFAGALLLRILHLAAVSSSPIFAADRPPSDSFYYHETALKLASGARLEVTPVTSPPYVAFLVACFALFGDDVVLPRVLQALLGALVPLAIFAIARRVHSEHAGVIAGVLAAIYLPYVFFDGELLKASLAISLLAAALLAITHAIEAQRAPFGFAGGTLLALATLMAGNSAPFLLAAGVYAYARRGVKLAAFFVAGCALVLIPYAFRPAMFPPVAGIHFFIGNHAGATGVYSPVEGITPSGQGHVFESRLVASRASGRALSASEADRYWFGRGLEFIRNEPGEAVLLAAKKAQHFFNAYEIPNNEDYYFTRKYSWVLGLPLATFGIICPLGLAGLVFGRKKTKSWGLFVAQLATMLLGTIYLFASARYRLPATPVLILFAGIFLAELYEARANKRRAAILALTAAALALAVNLPTTLDRDAFMRAAEQRAQRGR